jgi:glutathione S-transferase
LLKVESANEPFRLYLYDVSYYSGKIEMYMRYKEIPFERVELSASRLVDVLYKNTGIMKVPAVETPDGRWLKDSSPMIDWFEGEYPESEVVPKEPVRRFLSKLVEDYADEWLWRPAMYYRWKYDHKPLGLRLGKEIFDLKSFPFPLAVRSRIAAARQTTLFLKKDGVTRETEPHIEETYLKNLESLDLILKDSPYLLGDRPTLVDFGFMGPMFRHFSLDPTPARIMRERTPRVYEWVARIWNAKATETDLQSPLNDFAHPGWKFIFEDICRTYLPYLHRNAIAWKAGERRFDFETNGVTYPALPVVHYRVWCREELQRRFRESPEGAKEAVERLLEPFGGLGTLREDGSITSGLAHEFILPLEKRKRPMGLLRRLKLRFMGTPWDLPLTPDP